MNGENDLKTTTKTKLFYYMMLVLCKKRLENIHFLYYDTFLIAEIDKFLKKNVKKIKKK